MAKKAANNAMTDDQIREMLEEIVSDIDYDHYKLLFVEACIEDPIDAEQRIKTLIRIVRKFLK